MSIKLNDGFSNETFKVRADDASLGQAQSSSASALTKLFNEAEAKRDVIHGTVSYRIKGKVPGLRKIPTGFRIAGTEDRLTKLYDKLSKYRSVDSLGRTQMVVRHVVKKQGDTFRFTRPFASEELKEGENEKLSTLRRNFQDYKRPGHRRGIPSIWLDREKLPLQLLQASLIDETQGKAFTPVGIEVKSVDVVLRHAVPSFNDREDDDKPLDATKLASFAETAEFDEEEFEGGSVVFNGKAIRTMDSDSSDVEAESSAESQTVSSGDDFQVSQDELDLMVESLEHLFQEKAPISSDEDVITPLKERQITDITDEPAGEKTPLLKTAKKTNGFVSGLFGFFSRITSVVARVARFVFEPLLKVTSFIW